MVDKPGSDRYLSVIAILLILLGLTACDDNNKDTTATVTPLVNDDQQDSNVDKPKDDQISELPPLRILPLGDSITQGNVSYQSYRYPLWKKLVDTGINFDLLGSIKTNFQGDPQWPDYMGRQFDRDHEGHWGWKVEEVIEYIDRWMAGYTPDIVLMHLGTNDAFRDDDVDETVWELRELILHLRAKNPKVVLFVAELIPANYKKDNLNRLRNAIALSLPEFSSVESPLFLVDQFSGFSFEVNTHDGVHPNVSGEELMAQKWMDAMIAAGVLN